MPNINEDLPQRLTDTWRAHLIFFWLEPYPLTTRCTNLNIGHSLRTMHRINPQGTSKAQGQPKWIYDDTAIWLQRFDWTRWWLCMWLLSLRGWPRQLDNTQRNAEDGQSHPFESTMRSRIKCNSTAISKEIMSEAQFCRTAQDDLYGTPNRMHD